MNTINPSIEPSLAGQQSPLTSVSRADVHTAAVPAYKYGILQNFINGHFTPASHTRSIPVISPIDGTPLAEMPCSAAADLDKAVTAARAAFPASSRTPIKESVQVFFRYNYLLERDLKELAALVAQENRKTLAEAVAEVQKCIELTEFA